MIFTHMLSSINSVNDKIVLFLVPGIEANPLAGKMEGVGDDIF